MTGLAGANFSPTATRRAGFVFDQFSSHLPGGHVSWGAVSLCPRGMDQAPGALSRAATQPPLLQAV
jgi:hypothetical protein